MLFLLLKAALIGLSISMPIGPIATLLIKNTLERGFKAGLAVALGASLIDGFYGFIAASGFAFVAQFLDNYLNFIKFFFGFLLVIMGIFEVKDSDKISKKGLQLKHKTFLKTLFFVMLLTATNPITIIFFTGIFATISSGNFNNLTILIMSFGVFFGSFLWTFGLSCTISKIRHKISAKIMMRIKLASGLIISGFGLYGMSSF